MILEPQRIKFDTVSTISPSIRHEVMGPDAQIIDKLGHQNQPTCIYYFKNLYFRKHLGSQQTRVECTEVPHTPHSPTCIASPTLDILHQSGAFVTKDNPTLTGHHHPKSTVYIRFTLGAIHSTTCIY